MRSTRKFLEEQASEREIERDDAARQIHALEEQIKEREREKVRDYRKTSEVSSTLNNTNNIIINNTILYVVFYSIHNIDIN